MEDDLPPDQLMELDLIRAMFPDGAVSEVHACTKHDNLPAFTVQIARENDAPNEIALTVAYPPGYPEEQTPFFILECVSSTRRIPLDALLQDLQTIAAENSGTHCVSPAVQKCQEFLFDFDAAADKAKKSDDKKVDIDPTIRLGTPLTAELFNEWKERRAMMRGGGAAAIATATAAAAAKSQRLTGRQMWDATLKNADWALFKDGEGGATADDDDGEDIDYTFGEEEEEEPQ